MKTRLGVKGVREGVAIRVGVCRASGSRTPAGGKVMQGGTGAARRGALGPGGDSDLTGRGAEAAGWLLPSSSSPEESSGTLQTGRWASRTSSRRSFCFCSSAISFCRLDCSDSS